MQAITGDSVFSKFEKTRSALEDSLKRVEDIVPQSIGCQVRIIFSRCYVLSINLLPCGCFLPSNIQHMVETNYQVTSRF